MNFFFICDLGIKSVVILSNKLTNLLHLRLTVILYRQYYKGIWKWNNYRYKLALYNNGKYIKLRELRRPHFREIIITNSFPNRFNRIIIHFYTITFIRIIFMIMNARKLTESIVFFVAFFNYVLLTLSVTTKKEKTINKLTRLQ